MMNKDAKKNYVEEMKKNFTANESVMIAQYQGLNVNELDKLRKETTMSSETVENVLRAEIRMREKKMQEGDTRERHNVCV